MLNVTKVFRDREKYTIDIDDVLDEKKKKNALLLSFCELHFIVIFSNWIACVVMHIQQNFIVIRRKKENKENK